jgi:hypothetical protein
MDATEEQYVSVDIAVHIEIDQLPPISMALNAVQLEEEPPQGPTAREELEGMPFTGVVSMVRRYVETAAKLHAVGQGKDSGNVRKPSNGRARWRCTRRSTIRGTERRTARRCNDRCNAMVVRSSYAGCAATGC